MRLRHACSVAMLVSWMAPVLAAQPGTVLPPGTLPQLQGVVSGSITTSTAPNKLTITQGSQRAVIDWHSFNIAQGSAVRFNQPNSSAAALNRIWDADPSIIQGNLSANGQVYLINRNGILFGRGSQVNVGGLVASALGIGESLFNTNLLSVTDVSNPAFSFQGSAAQYAASFIEVEEGSALAASTGGRIMLLAPRVANRGSILTPEGQTILAAGAKVYLTAPLDSTLRGFLVEVDPYTGTDTAGNTVNLGGQVANDITGKIVAERGNVTFAGLAVNQKGRVTATTSVNLNGSVRLLARDSVQVATDPSGVQLPLASRTGTLVLGEGSVTEVLPDGSGGKTVLDEQTFTPSRVDLVGKTVHLQRNARVVATGGNVSITAQAGQVFQVPGQPARDDVRVYLDHGSIIDVSGTQDVALSVARNIVEVELRGTELADSPLQRDSFLRGQKIRVDVRTGTPFADISGTAAQIGRGIGEKTTQGGAVSIKSEGDIVMRSGATVDVSGGSLRYAGGYLNTTQLISNGKAYDIGGADPNRIYSGIAGQTVVRYAKWGVTEVFKSFTGPRYEAGYVEGKNAGTASFVSHGLVLDGNVVGRVIAGANQRELSSRPLGGRLVIGDASQAGVPGAADFKLAGVTIGGARSNLPEEFSFEGVLPIEFQSRVELTASQIRDGGISRLEVYSNGEISVAAGTTLQGPAGGSISLTGRRLDIAGDIIVPGGAIALTSRDVLDGAQALSAADVPLYIRSGVRLSAAGGWVNDYVLAGGAEMSLPIALNGGSISVRSGGDVYLEAGSVADVSGGGWADSAGKLRNGAAGSITIASGRVGLSSEQDPQRSRMLLAGTLQGYAASGGGTLNLSASRIRIGATASADHELSLLPEFFTRGGFARYSLSGQDGVNVASGTDLSVQTQNRVPKNQALRAATGSDLATLSEIVTLPAHLRAASHLSLAAPSAPFGTLTIGENARVAVAPGGTITLLAGRQMNVLGSITAPGGRIGLNMTDPSNTDSFLPDQSIWLGNSARLDVSGIYQPAPDNQGLRKGDVLNGGSVSIRAGKGYIVAEAGSLIDVSGASALLDLRGQGGGANTYYAATVGSHAGSIILSAREGVLSDAQLRGKPGSSTASGGSLKVAVEVTDSNPFLPSGDRVAVLTQEGPVLPVGLAPGQEIDTALFNGKALIRADRIAASGMDNLTLSARDRIEFDGSVNLALRRSITLDAPVIAGTGDGTVRLDAAYVALGNANIALQSQQTPAGGLGRLEIAAGMIDLVGRTALRGFGSVQLESAGDLRLRGVLQGVNGREMAGALESGGDLLLRAAQIYPSTLSNFTLAVRGKPDGLIRFERKGTDTPVLSAGGILRVEAPRIQQAGVIKAPLGQIVLNAGDALVLEAGSNTSVSAEGQVIPFGRTELSGRDYVYVLSGQNSLLLDRPPEKRIGLNAASVEVRAEAQLDLSGGGDLYAYEFVPGPGGTRDVLGAASAPGSFAVLPSLGARYAPYDQQYYQGVSGISPGDAVYLSAGAGLQAGYYTVLPARYALLPGAYLVKPVAGHVDLAPGVSAPKLDGSQIVAGYWAAKLNDGGYSRDNRFSGFEVRSGTSVRTLAEYQETTANAFFSGRGLRTPADAGQLSVFATTALLLEGALRAGSAQGGRGAAVDISAPKIAVLGEGVSAPSSDYVRVGLASLSRLNAGSLLIGGERTSGAEGINIAVGAREVYVSTGSGATLGAPELILTASDALTIAAGSTLQSVGPPVAGQTLRIGNAATPGSGDGALLSVTSGQAGGLIREGVTRTRGTLKVQEGATLRTAGSVVMDATLDNVSNPALDIASGGSLQIGASRISVGAVPAGTGGMVFSSRAMDSFGALDALVLRSYSTFDIHGGGVFGGSELKRLEIEAAGIAGFSNTDKTMRVRAQSVVLSNPNGLSFSAPAPAPAPALGDGTLIVEAQSVVLGGSANNEAFAVRGFSKTSLLAEKEILVEGTGGFASSGQLTLSASRVGARKRADYAIAALGPLLTEKTPAVAAGEGASSGLGAKLILSGSSISHSGNVTLPSGIVQFVATGSAPEDGITLLAGSVTSVQGTVTGFSGAQVGAPAGTINLNARNASVTAKEGSVLDLRGVAGGDAGTLSVSVPKGFVQLSGTVLASAQVLDSGLEARQGRFVLDAGSVENFSALNAKLNQAGFTEAREIRARSGDLVIAAEDPLLQRPADRVVAREVRLSADDGDIEVGGIVDASGPKGGSITLSAGRKTQHTASAGNVTILSSAVLRANSTDSASNVTDANELPFGTRGRGGQVVISSTGTRSDLGDFGIDVRSGALIDVSGAGAAENGSVTLRTMRSGVLAEGDPGSGLILRAFAANIVSNAAGAAPRLWVEGTKIYSLPVLGSAQFARVESDNAAFAENVISNGGLSVPGFGLRAGVEVRSDADLEVAADWNLIGSRAGGEPGTLTLRAAGNLNINGTLSDGFNGTATTAALASGESWSYRLVGGADMQAADALAVRLLDTGGADVTIAAGKMVRTGTGSIGIAAARDIVLAHQSSVIYTAGVPGRSVSSFNVASIAGAAAEFPDGGGDVRLYAGHDIVSLGGSNQLINNWLYRQGKLDALNNFQFRNVAWWPRFRDFQQGVGALGGGDVVVTAGGNIANLSISVPTNGRLAGVFGEAGEASKLTVQGGGDLLVRAGGDIDTATFYVDRGVGRIRAGGNLGTAREVNAGGELRPLYSVVAMGDAQIGIETSGSLKIEAVLNPTIVSQAAQNKADNNRRTFFATYSESSSLQLVSQGGDVTLSNDTAKLTAAYGPLLSNSSGENGGLVLYPGNVRVASLSGDVIVAGGFQMFPSARGNLELLAQGSVTVAYGGNRISMSDVDPARLASPLRPASAYATSFGDLVSSTNEAGFAAHGDPALHRGDGNPVRIIAITGDIVGPSSEEAGVSTLAVLPKAAIIEAGRDIRNPFLVLQNLEESDVTRIRAGRDIVFDTLRTASGAQRANSGRIETGGPGSLIVSAGRNLDLGNSSGIVSRGNLNNPYLPEQGANILAGAGAREPAYADFAQKYLVQTSAYRERLASYMRQRTGNPALSAEAGLNAFLDLADTDQAPFLQTIFFEELRLSGRDAPRLSGETGQRYKRGFDAISALYPESRNGQPSTQDGDIDLFFSQIKTEQGGAIHLMAPGGLVNAGLANPGALSKSASELGIVTLRGGSIEAYAHRDFLVNQSRVFTLQGGDILIWSSEGNIDAGKGAKTARATPPPQLIVRGDQFILDTSNSVAGSGIAVLLAKDGIVAGDVDLIAPRGEVNAGDAGIRAAGNINIAAVRVVGADNISVGGISTGVALTQSTGISAAAAGAGNVGASAVKSAGDIARDVSESTSGRNAPPETYRPTFINVEVLSFGQ